MSNPIPPSANPRFGAEHIARMLDQDPVMAGMVKEFIPPERLREVLSLTPKNDLDEVACGMKESMVTFWCDEWLREHE